MSDPECPSAKKKGGKGKSSSKSPGKKKGSGKKGPQNLYARNDASPTARSSETYFILRDAVESANEAEVQLTFMPATKAGDSDSITNINDDLTVNDMVTATSYLDENGAKDESSKVSPTGLTESACH